MRPDTAAAVTLAFAIGLGAMGMLRLIDLNEKEPVWALLLLAWLGFVAAGVAALLTGQDAGQESALAIALTAELAKAAAFGCGLGLLAGVARFARRASEVNGLVDFLIYGAAAGAGFAIGDGLLRDTFATAAEIQTPFSSDTLDRVWISLQSVLLEALTAAIFAASVGLARNPSAGARRVLLPFGGIAAAIAVHERCIVWVNDGAPTDADYTLVALLATAAMLAVVAAAVVYALRVEKRTIVSQLARETDDRVVTREELERFARPAARRRLYAEHFLRGDLDAWQFQRWLQNRQAQLALTVHEREAGEGVADARLAAIADVMRAAIRHRRERFAGATAEAQGGSTARVRLLRPFIAALAAAIVVLGGVAIVAGASGPEAPTTTATRLSEFKRAHYELRQRDRPANLLKHQLQQLVGAFRLVTARRADLAGVAESEAYALEYRDAAGARVRYLVVGMESAEQADEKRGELIAAAADGGRVWQSGSTLSAVIGEPEPVDEFCGELPIDRRPDELGELRSAVRSALPDSWETDVEVNGFTVTDPRTGARVAVRAEPVDPTSDVRRTRLAFVACGSKYVVTPSMNRSHAGRYGRMLEQAVLAVSDVR